MNTLRFQDRDTPVAISGQAVIGKNTNDSIGGSEYADLIDGAGGNDTIDGLGANDTLIGGVGNDTLIAGSGNDICNGGVGVDVYTANSSASVTINLNTGVASGSQIGTDVLWGVENAVGGTMNDVLTGSQQNNLLNGGAGNDVLFGGRGLDKLIGGLGEDVLVYTDLLDSSSGVKSRDTIDDFQGGAGDTIDLSALDAFTPQSGNQSFTYIGSATFTGTKGEVRFANGVLQINTNNDKSADMEIVLTKLKTFSAGFLIP